MKSLNTLVLQRTNFRKTVNLAVPLFHSFSMKRWELDSVHSPSIRHHPWRPWLSQLATQVTGYCSAPSQDDWILFLCKGERNKRKCIPTAWKILPETFKQTHLLSTDWCWKTNELHRLLITLPSEQRASFIPPYSHHDSARLDSLRAPCHTPNSRSIWSTSLHRTQVPWAWLCSMPVGSDRVLIRRSLMWVKCG